MANILSGSEIVQVGIQIEKNGFDFYSLLSANSKSKKAKEIFKYLAGEEEKHIHVFEKILSTVENLEPAESYSGEFLDYINGLADEYVFTKANKGLEIAKTLKGDKEAVDKGIGFEKDSIIFYEGIKKAIPAYDAKLVDQLIAQEKMHLKQLLDLKEVL